MKKVLKFKNFIYLSFQILVWNFCIDRSPICTTSSSHRVPESKLKKMKACTVGLATTPAQIIPLPATIGVLIVIKRYQPVAHITIFCSKLFLSWKKSFVSHLSSSSSFATFFMIVRLVTKISDSLTNTAIPHKMQIYLKESKTNNGLVTSPILWNNLAYQWWYNRKDLRR